MTQAGEMGGVLESSLMRVADQLEKDASLRRQIRSAMVYPVLVIVVAVGVMLALCAFLVPVFEQRVQGIRRRIAGDHAGLGVPVQRGHQLLVGDVPRHRRAGR